MSSRPSRILVVELHRPQQHWLGGTLVQGGYQVVEAIDGLDALAHLREGELFGVMVTDVQMPRMGGVELALVVQEEFPSIPILFVLPAANLRQRPRASQHATAFASQDEFDQLMEQGKRAIRARAFDAALRYFDRCIALSPEHALAHFVRGKALVHLGEAESARAAFQEAVDLDHWTHRITSNLEEVLVTAARDEGVPLVDLRAIFKRDLSSKHMKTLFIDHVHPTAVGHERIAEMIQPEVSRLLGLHPTRN